MFGLIRKKKVKDAIEFILNRYKDCSKDDVLFENKSDQYFYYIGNLNCAEYIKHKCLTNRKAEREAKKAIKLMLNRCERKDGETDGE